MSQAHITNPVWKHPLRWILGRGSDGARTGLGRGSDGARTGLGRNSGEHILLVGGINKTDNADHRDPSQRRRHPLDVAAWRHGTKPGARAGSGWWSGSPVSLSRRLLGKNFSIERGSFPPGGNFLFFFKYFFSRFLTTWRQAFSLELERINIFVVKNQKGELTTRSGAGGSPACPPLRPSLSPVPSPLVLVAPRGRRRSAPQVSLSRQLLRENYFYRERMFPSGGTPCSFFRYFKGTFLTTWRQAFSLERERINMCRQKGNWRQEPNFRVC